MADEKVKVKETTVAKTTQDLRSENDAIAKDSEKVTALKQATLAECLAQCHAAKAAAAKEGK